MYLYSTPAFVVLFKGNASRIIRNRPVIYLRPIKRLSYLVHKGYRDSLYADTGGASDNHN